MSAHTQFADDLCLYALGALEGDAREVLERHLKECAECRRELEQLRGDAALLAFSVSGPRPPARARERLMAAIANQPRRMPAAEEKIRPLPVRPEQGQCAEAIPTPRSRWFGAFGWAAAVAALVMVFALVQQKKGLQRRVADLEISSAAQQQQLAEAKELMASLTSADAERFTLVAGKTPLQPQGRAIYLRRSGTLVFLASHMPALPPEKVYELWLIPANGAPIPAGLFRPRADGNATVVKPPLPAGVEAKTFAITVEPASGSAAPTSQPILVGTRS